MAAAVETLRFGVLTDCQYADIPTPAKSKRQYRLSPQKLQEAVDAMNAMPDLDFTIHLGDMVDQDFESYAKVMPIFRQLRSQRYQCLGNHDYQVKDEEKSNVLAALDMTAPFYSWVQKGWRLLVLDGNDLSLFSHPKGHPKTLYANKVRESMTPKPADYNGGLGATQLTWVRQELDLAEAAGQPVLIFGHYPVLPTDPHVLWDAPEFLSLVSEFRGLIRTVFCGHNHDGNYAARHDTHFLNFRGMVDTFTNSFARVEAAPDLIRIIGFGREPHRHMPFPAMDYLPKPAPQH